MTTRTKPRRAKRALPPKTIALLDRNTVAWQDHQGTWRGKRGADTCIQADAPPGFHIHAVLQPDDPSTGFGPYLWIGIAAPDTHEARVCYATIGGNALRELARELLRYLDAPTKGGAR